MPPVDHKIAVKTIPLGEPEKTINDSPKSRDKGLNMVDIELRFSLLRCVDI